MKKLARRRTLACVGILALLAAGVSSYVFAAELAFWRIHECQNVFRLTAENPRCRAPALWAWSGIAEVVVALSAGLGLIVKAHLRRGSNQGASP
jgi:hypothetical protein